MRKPSIVQPDPKSWLQKFHYSTLIKIRYCETDLLGHVNNVSYFMYFEQGRIDYFDHLQVTEELFGEQRVSVVADLQCEYFAPVYLQELIRLHVRTVHLGRSSLELEYALLVADELRASGRCVLVMVNPKDGKSTPIPEAVRGRIAAFDFEEVNDFFDQLKSP